MEKDFVALLEFSVTRSSEVLEPDVRGGMARMYVCSADESTARRAFEKALFDDGLSLVEYEWIVVDEDVEWEQEEDEEAQRCIHEARKGGVVFGRLDVWGAEAVD